MAPGGAPNDANLSAVAQRGHSEEGDKSTTTLSTIAVKAGVNASIVVALLKVETIFINFLNLNSLECWLYPTSC